MEKQALKEFKELKLQSVEKALDYKFKNKSRLIQAFTTKSHAKEKKDEKISVESQDSLRTLGDAILKNTLIEILINLGLSTPKDITEKKKNLESREHLAIIFKNMKIPFACFKKGGGETENNQHSVILRINEVAF